MTQWIKKHIHLLAVLSIAGQGLIYTLIAQLSGHKAIPVNYWFDDRIPYLSWFVIPYAIWMPLLYIAFIYLGVTNRSLYIKSILTYNIAVLISNLVFILYPTHMPRPDIAGTDIFNTLVQFIYSNDQPVNCLPSIHCLTSYLLLITMNRHKLLSPVLRTVFSIVFWSIIASTVFIKQHGLIDVIGGIVLAEITYQVVYYMIAKQQTSSNTDKSAAANA